MNVAAVQIYHLASIWLILQGAFVCCGERTICPNLQFWSDHGCQPCSLCDPHIAEPKNQVRNECRIANPDPFADGSLLWCDVPDGPFPECPAIHPSALQSPCSESCKANFRTFAPGCLCTVGCHGQLSHTVVCTDRLQWNSTDIPSRCLPPSSITVGPVSSETWSPRGNKTTADEDMILPIVTGSLVVVIIFGITMVIITTCLYRRLRARLYSSQPAEPASYPLLRGGAGSHSKPSEKEFQMSSAALDTDQNGKKLEECSADGVVVVPVQDPFKEKESAQQRETGGDPNQEESVRALKALMSSRQDLLELSKRFDQSYAFDKVTWHDVAVDLLDWDKDDLHHTEYRCLPMSGGPGEGPMYRVLEGARQEGKGLLDLIACLQRQGKKHESEGSKETEQLLWTFWQNWKSKQDPAGLC